MKRLLEGLIRQALEAAHRAGSVRTAAPPSFTVEVPGDAKFGDLSTNVALTLARGEGKRPHDIARGLAEQIAALAPAGWLASVDVAGPGFINFRLADAFWQNVLRAALAAGDAYGNVDLGRGRGAHVEFVSANPTGPLHVGHGRGAVTGDVIARLLEAAGYAVEREYYVNDHGRQMEILGRSTLARYRQLFGDDVPLPEDGYPGEYLVDVARRLREEKGEALRHLPPDEAAGRCARFAGRVLLAEIERDLADFGVRFDHFVSERALHGEGALEAAMAALPPDVLYRDEGALFFRTTTFGDEKDRAVLRGSGQPTYFGGDLAHYHHTLRRPWAQLVNVLGADHHGYVARLRAIVGALGGDPDVLHVVLVQLVNLTRGGEPVRMGKRAGEFVTLREVLDEVGPDAARFFFLMRKADSQLEFDLELAKQQSTDNPVFYVQYAHARIASVFRQAAEAGVSAEAAPDLTPLGEPEVEVLRLIASWPDVVEAAARDLEPHRIVFYALELAGGFHRYYNRHRFLTDDRALTQARLALARCVQQVLRRALGLAGVAAPERM
jgi:arginyl-tRNA synthetase